MKELVYHHLLLPTVERNADRAGFFEGEYRATFGEHLDRVARLAAGLRGLGVDRGDRFAVMALNGHQFLECYHAAFLGAGVINPLNLRLAPKERLGYEGVFHRSVLRAGRREGARRGGYRPGRDDRRG